MLSIPEALDTQAKAALTKARDLKRPGAFTVSGLLGGAYVGVGVILMVSTAGPLLAAGDPLTKLVSGLVFGVALTLVVFAGAELVTSTMMTAVQGFAAKSIGGRTAVRLIATTFAL
ncbi:MAG: formate/nitrite transporter family protein, partial [Microbacteriaceae bacterium]